ncbi:sortase [Butyrivibrio fibrisolvens]|uniref:sortase n=1 Tax=Butyrivibrio fibrisolvens TaxID=831 RepID=UPI0004108F95|nr:sortase [Butyrivibrio fibrisolvens]
MKMTKGKVMMAVGFICIIGAMAFVVRNNIESRNAGDLADSYMTLVEQQIPDHDDGIAIPKEGEMPAIDVDGNSFIGIVSIPALDISLPIQRDWSSQNAKISPCRYKGSVYENNLIVAGHNYDRHFGRLKNLVSGDTVIITDVNGLSFYYTVTYTEIIDSYGVDLMDQGDWDLTVFTCTIGGSSRVTVRCEFTGKVVVSDQNLFN